MELDEFSRMHAEIRKYALRVIHGTISTQQGIRVVQRISKKYDIKPECVSHMLFELVRKIREEEA